MDDLQTAQQFFDSLWPEVPEDQRILVWTLPDRRSHWLATTAAAAALAVRLAATHDVYTAVSLQPAGLTDRQRGDTNTATALCGLWADVDIAGPGHTSKKAYPEDMAGALRILYDELLPAPTWLIHTGGGVHAWWLFDEPLELTDEASRQRAARLSEDWQALYRDRAAAAGYTFDSTHDLVRVLRVPGTSNRKNKQQPRPVNVQDHSDVRIGAREAEELLAEIRSTAQHAMEPGPAPASGKVVTMPSPAAASTPPATDAASGIVIRQNAAVSPADLQHLNKRFSLFLPTWMGRREDWPPAKQNSQSEYDLALANMAALAGWPDQRIVDLLISNRFERQRQGPKHIKYYLRTLAEAKAWAAEIGPDSPPATPPPAAASAAEPEAASTPSKRRPKKEAQQSEDLAFLRDAISELLDARVLRLVKIGRDDPQYRLETEQGDVLFSSIDEINSQHKFRNAVAAALDRIVRYHKNADWPDFVRGLMRLITREETDLDSEIAGSTAGWLVRYLEDVGLHTSWEEARDVKDHREEPHAEEGAIFVNATHFRVWVVKTLNESCTPKAIAMRLKLLGANTKKRSIRRPQSCIHFWRLPPEDFDPQDFIDPLDAALETINTEAPAPDSSHIV